MAYFLQIVDSVPPQMAAFVSWDDCPLRWAFLDGYGIDLDQVDLLS